MNVLKKVLVTGASGFIGRHSLKYLTAKFDEVHATHYNRQDSGKDTIHWHKINILNKNERDTLLKLIQPSHLLHFAWYTEPGKYAHSILNVDWLNASFDLIQQFRENGGLRVVCSGTCFEYDLKYGFCSELETPKVPSTLYGVCKNSLQEILRHYSEITGLSSAWGRIFYLYGPYEYSNRLVSSVIISLLKDEYAECSEGNIKKDFLHVEDVANAFVKLLESSVEGAVNIGSGIPVSIKELVSRIGEILEKEKLIKFGARKTPESESPLVLADERRLVREVEWIPKYNLESGLKDTISWWKNYL